MQQPPTPPTPISGIFEPETPPTTATQDVQTPPTETGTLHGTSMKRRKTSTKLHQMYLDLGQKDFGRQRVCKTCGMLFVVGVPEDTLQHAKICQEYLEGVLFPNMKNARVVHQKGCVAIVEIRPCDPCFLRQKAKRVESIVDQDLGFMSNQKDEHMKRFTVYFYVEKQRVLGFASVELISRAHVLETPLQRSSGTRSAALGIHKIWVHNNLRKQGVATSLLDVIRAKLVYGMTIPPQLVAFSSPTEAGAKFAQSYLRSRLSIGREERTERESQVLVYDCQG